MDGELVDQGVYKYVLSDQDDVLVHALDLDVIQKRTNTSSATSGALEDFYANLLKRDGCCVWTGLDGDGRHIIPYERGEEVCSTLSFRYLS